MPVADGFPLLPLNDIEEKYRRWLRLASEMHEDFEFCGNPEPAWTPLRKPLPECRVALLSTAGVHLRRQQPFDLMDRRGDWSFREIPGDVVASDLMASHSHYDTADANQDINCVFPIDAVRTLASQREIGGVSPLHVGMMGFVPSGARLRDASAPAVAARLRDVADVVLLTPG